MGIGLTKVALNNDSKQYYPLKRIQEQFLRRASANSNLEYMHIHSTLKRENAHARLDF